MSMSAVGRTQNAAAEAAVKITQAAASDPTGRHHL